MVTSRGGIRIPGFINSTANNRERKFSRLNYLWYQFLRRSCKILFKLFFHVHIYGQENIPAEGAFVLICNHQSFLDPIVCAIFIERPVCFLTHHTFFNKPLLKWILYSVNTIPIKMDEINLSAIKIAVSKLKQGSIVCIFPESTRTYDGKILPFKPGFGLLSRLGKTPAVPLMIDGTFECWPRNKKIFSPGAITLCCGQAFSHEQVASMNDKEFAELLTYQFRQMQNAYRIKHGREPYLYDN